MGKTPIPRVLLRTPPSIETERLRLLREAYAEDRISMLQLEQAIEQTLLGRQPELDGLALIPDPELYVTDGDGRYLRSPFREPRMEKVY